jgi:putative phosphoribosyl transferase
MEKLIHINDEGVELEGMLTLPPNTKSIVLFAHGSGSSRFSPRNNYVAKILNAAGLGTLLTDLLSEEEDEIYKTRFDINLLSKRLLKVIQWLENNSTTANFSLGLFGASTGAAAALQAASILKDKVKAVVSRGGRPDLAIPVIHNVTAPTLLIVGGHDFGVIELNQEAFDHIVCEKSFEIVPNATHLFEEPGTLDEAARLAKEWFKSHLS